MYGDEWPLRVTGIASAAESEWRIGQQTPERTCEGWLLVYVKSGMVEELCDTHRVLLRAGQILFHQPAELFAMRAVGEVPPEVFRVEFTADGSAMDSFRSCHMRLGNAEKSCLRQLAETVREVFQPVQDACQMPARRAEIPFGGKELQTIYLAQLLYLLARRRQRTRKQSPRARAEQEQAALVESVRLYFAQNIEKPLALDQVCDANGCSRVALQQAFRARTRMGPMEYFSCMKAEQAALLLTQGYGPGETARMLGYGSLAWFSRRFHALTGQTPGAYRRAPHPLVKLAQLLKVEYVLEGLQGHLVDHLVKRLQGFSSYPLGGGIGGDQLRVLPLKLPQFAGQPVEFIVLDLRFILIVVAAGMVIDNLPQLLYAPARLFQVHTVQPAFC